MHRRKPSACFPGNASARGNPGTVFICSTANQKHKPVSRLLPEFPIESLSNNDPALLFVSSESDTSLLCCLFCDKAFKILEGPPFCFVFFLLVRNTVVLTQPIFNPTTPPTPTFPADAVEVSLPLSGQGDVSTTTKRRRHLQGLFSSSSLPASASLLAQSRPGGRHCFLVGEASNDANQAAVFRCVRSNRRDGGKLAMQRDESGGTKGVQEVSGSPR